MLRSIALRPYLSVALAVVWFALLMGYTMARETPVGTVEGRVLGADTGRPISGARVYLEPRDVAGDGFDSMEVVTKANGSFQFTDVPFGDYVLRAEARVHNLPPISVTVTEGKKESLDLELAPNQPYLNLYVHQHTFTAKEQPRIVLEGFTESDEVTVTLHKVNIEKLLSGATDSFREALLNSDQSVTQESLAKCPAVESKQTIKVRITKRTSEGSYYQRVKLSTHSPGMYVVTASANDEEAADWISVSDLGIITKEGGPDLLIYAVRPDSGKPVAGARVTVIENKKPVAEGITDASGVWKRSIGVRAGGASRRLVVGRLGGSVGFVTSYAYEPVASSISIYTYTDRPVYRPGQQVYFKGIVRKLAQDAYRVPAQGQAKVDIYDRRGTLLYARPLPLSRFGSFHGNLRLPVYAATGGYFMNCSFGGQAQTASFEVQEYRKPEFSVKVEMPKKRVVRGATVRAKVRAEYYFGGPVAGAEVRYYVSRADYWFWPDEEDYGYDEYENDGDYWDYGETVLEGKARTNEDGTVEIEFPAVWQSGKDEYGAADKQFTISAFVTDPSRREATGEGSIIATQGEFKLTVRSESYVGTPGQPVRVTIKAADYDNKPQAGVSVNVVASRMDWERGDDKKIKVASAKVRTDKAGQAMFSFTPSEAGSYVITATCRDRGRHHIQAADYVWVSGYEDIGGYRYPDLELVLDKKSYNPGDTAKLLVNSKAKSATALITVEGRRLFDYKTVYLKNKSTLVEIPVKREYVPNFYIGVCYVKGKDFQSQEARAKVSLKAEALKITVAPDKKKYEPGERATYLVKAVDGRGRPTQAEVSLGVVDEAVYAIREDQTTPIQDFFYAHRPNSVLTHYSFPDIYLSADKGLALMASMPRAREVNFTGRVRKQFLDTAFWLPDIVTDAAGEARVSFNMPDNLTTWRATARAATLDTKVGQTTSSAVVTQNLLVRLETPRFLVQKDETLISALVHNYLPKSQGVKVALEAPGLKILDRATRKITVASRGMERVEWRVAALRPGTVSMTAYAVGDVAQDAMQLSIPVLPHGQRKVEDRTGSVANGASTARLLMRADAVPGASEIRIRLAPSLAAAMLGSLRYLAEYPYGCTEQTLSAFLPDVVIWRTLKQLNISEPELRRILPDMVGKGLNRLYDFQHEDGGWGWCEYGSDDSWMTSYVVFGLLTARSSGFEINERVLESGLRSMERQVTRSHVDTGGKVYALYVLSLAGRKDFVTRHIAPILRRRGHSAREMALVAMTLANIGDFVRAKEYAARLWGMASVGGDQVYWRSGGEWYYDEPTETTAYALMAVIRLTPDDPRIPKVVRWIMRHRNLDHWYSTRDTAMLIYALSGYLARTKELQPNFTAIISHNDARIAELHFDKSAVFQPEKEIVIHPEDIRKGANVIKLEAKGPGVLYYTLELSQFVTRKAAERTITGSGITVSREYRKLVSAWDERAKAYRLQPSRSTTTDFRSGDVIRVRLIVTSPREYRHVLVEDYLPAGCEGLDRGRVEQWEWEYWWVDRDVRDDRVSFYVDTLHGGKSVLEYEMRAGVPGTYTAMPPSVQAMYQPAVNASGLEEKVGIR